MNLKSKWLIVFPFATLFIFNDINQSYATDAKDSLLIADMIVQIEATQALNDMYNFKFTLTFRSAVFIVSAASTNVARMNW